jgi:ATP-dependent exoDNAse (exonuclease V) beta subunit
LLKVLHDTAVDAHERFAQLKRRRVVIDYDDMMAYAVAVLERFPAVAGAVRANIQQVLVDEFQDTNPLQYQLLQLLVPDLLPGGERGPELFAVGDDKASMASEMRMCGCSERLMPWRSGVWACSARIG